MAIFKTTFLKRMLQLLEPYQDRLNNYLLFKKTFQVLYNKFAPDEWVLVKIEGVNVYINTHDGYISRFIIQKGAYEPGITKVFRNIIKEEMTFIDIGAASGYYSLIAASFVGNGRVFAFEPYPFNYRLLIRNILFNGFSNILPIKKAVSDKTGTTKLFCSRESGGHSIIMPEDNYIEVETITLDDFFEENQIFPDVIKMDVEGAELLVMLFDTLKEHLIYLIKEDGDLVPIEKARERKEFEPNLYCVRESF